MHHQRVVHLDIKPNIIMFSTGQPNKPQNQNHWSQPYRVNKYYIFLDYMHHQRVVHLDIKPNNIMFATGQPTDLRIKIIDLGLARELGGSEKVYRKWFEPGRPLLHAEVCGSWVVYTIYGPEVPGLIQQLPQWSWCSAGSLCNNVENLGVERKTPETKKIQQRKENTSWYFVIANLN